MSGIVTDVGSLVSLPMSVRCHVKSDDLPLLKSFAKKGNLQVLGLPDTVGLELHKNTVNIRGNGSMWLVEPTGEIRILSVGKIMIHDGNKFINSQEN